MKSAIASQLPLHILEGDSNIFSLSDLERVKSGELLEQLKNSVEVASDHVTSCEVIWRISEQKRSCCKMISRLQQVLDF